MTTLEQQLYDALKAAQEHMKIVGYGYGDPYAIKRPDSIKLREQIDAAIKAADAIKGLSNEQGNDR